MNCIYYIHPSLTLDSLSTEIISFYEKSAAEMERYTTISAIRHTAALLSARPSSGDAVAFFNCTDDGYGPEVRNFLEEAAACCSEFLPIAFQESTRRPPTCIPERQSFDVVEQLRRRSLLCEQVSTVATIFAREVLARVQPTLSVSPMRLFLSHRRLDGECIAASIHKQLQDEATVWRDLMQIRIGEDAQEKIETALLESDAVVFIDTPKSGESEWIAKELQTALGLNLPIVWVRIGPASPRSSLRVIPAEMPHFEFPDLLASDRTFHREDVSAIAQKAFELARATGTNRVLDRIRRLRIFAGRHGAEIKELDPRRLMFSVEWPRNGFRYPQRPMTHLVQAFARHPRDDDYRQFRCCASACGLDAHPHWGPYYDAALLLTPGGPAHRQVSASPAGLHVEPIDDYVAAVETYLARPVKRLKRTGLIISGAFPLGEPDFQQNLTDAVHAFTRAVLDRSGEVIFGAHPTFQHLIFELGRRCRGTDYQQAVRMYISEYFATPAAISEYKEQATIISTGAASTRSESLTLLRNAMVRDPEAAGMVVIGGRTALNGHVPGVDEEVLLAKEVGIPVFLIGSCGGRSAELAYEHPRSGISGNNLTAEDNQELATSTDYASLASLVLDSLEF